MSEDSYNGYSNRETWAVALHINNDQGWQESVLEALREAWGNGYISLDQPHRAGEIIRENVERAFDPSMYPDDALPAVVVAQMQDMGSLWRVNWDELGRLFLEDLES